MFEINGILAFWIAYILTRSFGASLGDLFSKPTANGGLGIGTTATSAVSLTIIVAMVVFLTRHVQSREREMRGERLPV